MATTKKSATASGKKKKLATTSTGSVDWSVFLQEGVIVALTIKRYRGTTTVDFSELGIDDSADPKLAGFLSEYIVPGTKRLIPPEIEGQLKSIETSARTNLKDHGFDCSAFASTGRFVPNQMYTEFKKINEELKERFYAIRDDFADNYDAIIEHVRKDYKVLAETLYMQAHPNAKRPSAKYVNSFVDKIIEQIPSSDEIVASFEYSVSLRRIPDHLLKVMSKKNDIDEKVMKIAASKPAAKKAERPLTVEEQIEKDIQESIEGQAKGQAEDFVTDVLHRVTSDAYEGADAIVKSIDKNNNKLVGRASIKAHSLIDSLDRMNYGDEKLDELLDSLKEALGTDKGERDIEAVKKSAQEICSWAEGMQGIIKEKTVQRKVGNTASKSAPSKTSGKTAARKTAAKPASKPTAKTTAAKSASKPAAKKTNTKTSTAKSAASAAKATQKPAAKTIAKADTKKKQQVKIAVPRNTRRRTIKSDD